MSDAQVRAHFNAGFLAVVSPDALNQGLEEVAGAKPVSIKLVSIKIDEPDMVAAIVATGGAVPQVRLSKPAADSHPAGQELPLGRASE
jgi:hypothetical protein